MVGLHESIFIASARDSIECLPESGSTNKFGASFETPSGRHLVTPSLYVEMITSLKPNLWASLADEVPAWVSAKRNRASVDRTLRWLDECLSLDMACGEDLLGHIVGGTDIKERKRCAAEVARRNVSGYWIGGFGLGESMEERPALLNVVMDNLPEDKLRVVSGLAIPEEVLQGVASGIDIFDSTYIYHLTLEGFALVFPLDMIESNSGADGYCTKINLKATIYRRDTSPIVQNCACFTCKNHTRAYINHLLNVHEMLAQILLEIHNTHHYMGFFRLIREAIRHGIFETFHLKYVESRREHIAHAVS